MEKPKNAVSFSSELRNKSTKELPLPDQKEEYKKYKKSGSIRITPMEKVIELLQKTRNIRNPRDIKIISDYLTEHFEYFKKIETTEPEKLDKLCKVVNIEKYTKGDPIIQYGEIGEKFYIVFKGSVEVYKPNYEEKFLSLGDFCTYMFGLKKEKNYLKYNRILEKNKHLNIDLNTLTGYENEEYYTKRKMRFLIEELELLGEFKEGFAFGEIALIKKTTRNATVIANDNCYLLSILKNDYNKMIRELEVKRLEKEINQFKIDFPIFENLGEYTIIEILNCCNHIKVNKGDIVFNQNDEDDNIYFIKNGIFQIYSSISFSWLNQFLLYIINSKQNIINLMELYKLKQDSDIIQMIAIEKKCVIPSPFKNNVFKPRLLVSNKEKEYPIDIKTDEEELNNPHKLFNVLIKIIDYKDIIGFEDSIELKKKFYTLKCISSKGELEKIHLVDFIRIIHKLNDQSLRNQIKKMIITKKEIFFQNLKNTLTRKAFKLQDNFQSRYEYIVEKETNKKNNEEQNSNKIILKNKNNEKISDEKVVSIKIRGWTKNLDDVLEQDIYLTRGKKRKENSIFTKIKEQFIKGNKNSKLVPFIKTELTTTKEDSNFPILNEKNFPSNFYTPKSKFNQYSNSSSMMKKNKNLSLSTNFFSSFDNSSKVKRNQSNYTLNRIFFSPKKKRKDKSTKFISSLYRKRNNFIIRNGLKTDIKENYNNKSKINNFKSKYEKISLDINKKNILGTNFEIRMNLGILKNPSIYTEKAINSATNIIYK